MDCTDWSAEPRSNFTVHRALLKCALKPVCRVSQWAATGLGESATTVAISTATVSAATFATSTSPLVPPTISLAAVSYAPGQVVLGLVRR